MYEEKSLGVYEESMDDDELNDDAHWDRHSVSRVAIWGKYLARHARRQLSFGESRTPAATAAALLTALRYVVASHLALPALHRRGTPVTEVYRPTNSAIS